MYCRSDNESKDSEISTEAESGFTCEDQTETNTQRNGDYPVENCDFITEQLLKEAESNGKKYFGDGKFEQAVPEYVRAMTLTRVLYGDTHWKLAASYVSLAQTYLQMKGFSAQAEYHSERAKSVMFHCKVHTACSDPDKLSMYSMLINLYHILAVTKSTRHKYPFTHSHLIKAEDILANLKQILPDLEESFYQKWNIILTKDFAQLYSKQKKESEANNKYQQLIDIITNSHGEDSRELIPVYRDWAKLVQINGKRASLHHSIDLFQKALSIATDICSCEDQINMSLMLAQTYALLAEPQNYGSLNNFKLWNRQEV
ncbi:tetratricopeptide repeat protein 23-like [Argonauta hians]